MIIVKAFNQEFKIDIKVEMSQFNVKVLTLIKSKRIDLLKELNDFIAVAEYEKVKSAAVAEYRKIDNAALAEYKKVKSAAIAEYQQKINKKLDELLSRI